jgi:hypothetical protein
MDTRLGIHGKRKPTHTLLGLPIGNSQITITRGLGNDYYCVVDSGKIPNIEELITELKEGIPSEPKPKRERKPVKADSKEGNTI